MFNNIWVHQYKPICIRSQQGTLVFKVLEIFDSGGSDGDGDGERDCRCNGDGTSRIPAPLLMRVLSMTIIFR